MYFFLAHFTLASYSLVVTYMIYDSLNYIGKPKLVKMAHNAIYVFPNASCYMLEMQHASHSWVVA